jgi:hypothetical protein
MMLSAKGDDPRCFSVLSRDRSTVDGHLLLAKWLRTKKQVLFLPSSGLQKSLSSL